MSSLSLSPLPSPLPSLDGPGPAMERYGRALAVLSAAERAVRNRPCPELERTTLVVSQDVIAARVSACHSLLESGMRLPAEVLFWLSIDEELLAIPLDA